MTLETPEIPDPNRGRLDTGLACLVMLARMFERPVEAEHLRHQRGAGDAPFGPSDLILAARSLDLKARAVAVKPKRLGKTPLPAIARAKDGRFFILARVSESKVLIQHPGEPRPQTLSLDDLAALWDGRLILVTSRAGLAGNERRFDISWFIPAVIKYRRLFGEVLLASFFLQKFRGHNTQLTETAVGRKLPSWPDSPASSSPPSPTM